MGENKHLVPKTRVTMLQNSIVNMIIRTLYLQKLNMMLKET